MIEGITGKPGVPRVRAGCDDCGREEIMACDFERSSSGDWRPNEGQALRKLEGRKWAFVKGTLRCPTCEAKRKTSRADPDPAATADPTSQPAPKEKAVVATKDPDLRKPTPAQKRQIIGLLEDAYDDDAKRYRNPSDNDRALAEAIGGGCLWGWVAEIREELFGPDTRSVEIEAIRAEVKRLDGALGKALGEVRKVEEALVALKGRLDKVA